MNKTQALEVLANYSEIISKIKGSGPEYEFLQSLPKKALKFAEDNKMGMVKEYIGFMQGALWVGGYLKLDNLRIKQIMKGKK